MALLIGDLRRGQRVAAGTARIEATERRHRQTPARHLSRRVGRIPTEQDQRVLRTGQPIINHLELQWHRLREPVWCLTTKLPLRDGDDRIIGIIGFSHDLRAALEADAIPGSLATALDECEQDPSRPVSPATLAARAGLSTTRLARLTRDLFGLTPSQLIAKTRITVASRLLHETTRAVAEIANACGYYDQSAFTRAFRITTGLTPNEYRRRERSYDEDQAQSRLDE